MHAAKNKMVKIKFHSYNNDLLLHLEVVNIVGSGAKPEDGW